MNSIEAMKAQGAPAYEDTDDFRRRALSIVLPVPFAVARIENAEALASSGDPYAN